MEVGKKILGLEGFYFIVLGNNSVVRKQEGKFLDLFFIVDFSIFQVILRERFRYLVVGIYQFLYIVLLGEGEVLGVRFYFYYFCLGVKVYVFMDEY